MNDDLLNQLADIGNKVLNDHYHERACSCSQWPASCATGGEYRFGLWDTDAFAIVLPAVIKVYEELRNKEVVL